MIYAIELAGRPLPDEVVFLDADGHEVSRHPTVREIETVDGQ